ncbi:glycosyltransferase family 2 protein [Rubritalea tangerina]|uniref:Glycosyltransferase family 2 protein n=1 Tax=Rubritalea tangerina TaxID=430798 RepID=A0ABW4ZBY5_9BACT
MEERRNNFDMKLSTEEVRGECLPLKDQDWAEDVKPLVSILCPAYNHVDYIEECLDSLLSQETNFPVEIIVRDDASTDGTAEIVEQYGKLYPKIIRTILEPENFYAQGVRATPILAEASLGEFCAMCECDDYWVATDKLQLQVELLIDNPECYMAAAQTIIKFDDGRVDELCKGKPQKLLSFYDLLDDCYLHTSTYLMRSFKQVLREWSDKLYLSDTTLRYIYSDLGPVVFLPKIVSVYRYSGKGIWSSLTQIEQVNIEIDLHQRFFEHFKVKYRNFFAKKLLDLYHWKNTLLPLGEEDNAYIDKLGVNEGALVSVCLPAYNHAPYVEQAIRSICSQTHFSIELIVVDDGSTDATASVIEGLRSTCVAHCRRFEFIQQKNQGVVSALNRAIESSHGEYIYIIASDDVVEPHAIATLCSFLDVHRDYALAVGDNAFIDDSGAECFWNGDCQNVHSREEATYTSFGDFLRQNRPDVNFLGDEFGQYPLLLKGNHVPNGYLLRRDAVVEVGGYDAGLQLEDYNLMLKLSKKWKFKYLDEVLFRYRWHGANTAKDRVKMIRSTMDVLANERSYCRYRLKLRITLTIELLKWKIEITDEGKVLDQLKLRMERWSRVYDYLWPSDNSG